MTNEQVKTQLMIMGFVFQEISHTNTHQLYNKDIDCTTTITIPPDVGDYYNFVVISPSLANYVATDSYAVILHTIKKLFKEKEDDKQRT